MRALLGGRSTVSEDASAGQYGGALDAGMDVSPADVRVEIAVVMCDLCRPGLHLWRTKIETSFRSALHIFS